MLRDRVRQALDQALAALGPAAGFPAGGSVPADPIAAAGESLRRARAALDERMVVALAGTVSAGKSTLANALVGGDLMATGYAEVTHTVGVLRYGERLRRTVHYRDGRPPWECPSAAELAKVITHAGSYAHGVDRVEVTCPYPYLRAFDLVDTPGFGSSRHADDAQAALRVLAGDGRHQATADQVRRADAVVLVIGRSGLSELDEDVLKHVQGASFGLSPINSVGVLNMVERLWPGDDRAKDPRETAAEVARLMMERTASGGLLHEVIPVCGKLAEGAATFTEQEFAELTELAGYEPAKLERRLANRTRFASTPYPELPLPPERRVALLDRFEAYGVAVCCRLLRDGVADPAVLRRELEEHSGITRLRTTLAGHFGGRAALIKAQRVVDEARGLPESAGDPRVRAVLERAVAHVERLTLDDPAFAELAVLRRYYSGELRLSPEHAAELLRVTGEHGSAITARLGMDDRAPDGLAALLDALEAAALERLGHWTAPPVGADAAGQREVARVLRRSYDEILNHLRTARIHLELTW